MSDTKIKFQVEGIQTIKNEMSDILKDVIKQTKLIDDSNKEFIKSLQQQIQLLKERNRVSSQFISGTSPQVQQDPTLSLSLKDLNSVLSELVEQMSKMVTAPSRTVSDKPGGTPTFSSGRINPAMIQSFALSNLINPMSASNPIDAGFGLMQNVSSGMMMMGGKAGVAGLIVALGLALGKMEIDILKEIEPEAARMARLQGGTISDYLNIGKNQYSDIGFKRSSVLSSRADLIRVLGRDSGIDLNSLLALQRGFNVSQEELLGVSRLGRGDSSFNLNRVFTSLYSGLQYSGLGKERTEAFIPEYLRLLTEIGQEQLTTLGKVDIGINTRLITALSGEGRLQNPDTLRTVVRGITQGISEAKTPQVEALQFTTLSRLFPEKSLWELEKIRAAPFGSGNESYLSEFIKDLQQRSSGKEDFERNISKVFNINPNLAESVANAAAKGNLDLLKKEITPQITEQDIYNRAINATDRFERAIAKFEEIKVGGLTKVVSDGFDSVIKLMSDKGKKKSKQKKSSFDEQSLLYGVPTML